MAHRRVAAYFGIWLPLFLVTGAIIGIATADPRRWWGAFVWIGGVFALGVICGACFRSLEEDG